MEVNKLINLNELSRMTGVKHNRLWHSIRYGKPSMIEDEDREKVLEAIESVSNSTNEAYSELKQFFTHE